MKSKLTDNLYTDSKERMNTDFKRTYQQIPTEFAALVFHHKLVKPFQVYMYLKCCNDSIVNRNSDAFRKMPEVLGFKSHNTVNKYLRQAIRLNWIGYNAISQNYFVRGISILRGMYGFHKRQSALFHLKDIQVMEPFLASVIVNSNIRNQKSYFERKESEKLKTAVKNTGAALQVAASSDSSQNWVPRRVINQIAVTKSKKKNEERPAYYGYSNRKIASLLKCSKTKATELKQKMEQCGFIETIPHTQVIAVLEKRDYTYRRNLYKAMPELTGKVFFRVGILKIRKNIRPKKVVEVVQQLYDEIVPKIKFTRVATRPSWFAKQKVA